VFDRTRGRIDELLASGTLDRDTSLFLANALLFRGKWQKPFEPEYTEPAPFHRPDQPDQNVWMMWGERDLKYAKGDGFQIVELPYDDGQLTMLVLLPDAPDGLPELESRLESAGLERITATLHERLIDLAIPRFKMTIPTTELAPALCSLGIRVAFDRRKADFSGIDGRGPDGDHLVISSVMHRASIEVDEEGTVAAAATGAQSFVIGSSRSRAIVFHADHPFLFAIRARANGAILFLGHVTEPTPAT
jgi:serpin B